MIQAAIFGRLGKDAQAIATKTGTPMTAASLAVDASPKDGDSTVWVKVLAFGRLAEVLAAHNKGDMLAASGRLELARWRGNDGAERESWQLIADALHSARTVRPRGGGRAKVEPRAAADDGGAPFDDGLPF